MSTSYMSGLAYRGDLAHNIKVNLTNYATLTDALVRAVREGNDAEVLAVAQKIEKMTTVIEDTVKEYPQNLLSMWGADL